MTVETLSEPYNDCLKLRLPSTGYILDLNKSLSETAQFQIELEKIRKALTTKSELHFFFSWQIYFTCFIPITYQMFTLKQGKFHCNWRVHRINITIDFKNQRKSGSITEFQGDPKNRDGCQTFGEGWKNEEMSVKEKVAILEALPSCTLCKCITSLWMFHKSRYYNNVLIFKVFQPPP